jgi:hypothetical protein
MKRIRNQKKIPLKENQANPKANTSDVELEPLFLIPPEPTERFVSRILIAIALVIALRTFMKFSFLTAGLLVALPTYLPGWWDKAEFRTGRMWTTFAHSSYWKWLASYFSASLRLTEKLDPTKQYIFAGHPHGLGSWHHLLYMTSALDFQHISLAERRRHLCASVLFNIPIVRDFFLWIGGVDAGKETAEVLLAMGEILFI